MVKIKVVNPDPVSLSDSLLLDDDNVTLKSSLEIGHGDRSPILACIDLCNNLAKGGSVVDLESNLRIGFTESRDALNAGAVRGFVTPSYAHYRNTSSDEGATRPLLTYGSSREESGTIPRPMAQGCLGAGGRGPTVKPLYGSGSPLGWLGGGWSRPSKDQVCRFLVVHGAGGRILADQVPPEREGTCFQKICLGHDS